MAKPAVSVFLDSSDLDALVTIRPNLLLYGDRVSADAFLSSLPSRFLSEIREVGIAAFGSGSAVWPRTAVLRNVAQCVPAEQEMLLACLEHRGRDFQLITTTERPLVDLVEEGQFDARLFYRLNMMFVDLNGRNYGKL